MIYSLWFCYLRTHIKSYSQGISILLLILNIFDLAKGSDLGKFNSQGNKFEIITKEKVQPNFCNENLENLFNYTSVKQQSPSQLSSNHKPSNQNSSSSTTTTLLPQGNKFVKPHFTLYPFIPPINRIDNDEKKNIPPIAGCIDLGNYHWKYDGTFHNDATRLSDVQIFLFHLNSSSTDQSIDVNLRILLYSTQEPALNIPVVIVLSSFLPRKFYLSAISFLSHSHQPLHLILTHPKSEVVIKDEQLTDADLKNLDRLFISISDLSKDRVFLYQKTEKEFIAQVQQQFKTTSIYNRGYFNGMDYNFLSNKNITRKLWIFNNEVQYSLHKPNMRIAAIYLVHKNGYFIDLILGKPIPPTNLSNKDFFTTGCQHVNALTDVIVSFQKYEFIINKEKTCYYGIRSATSRITQKYETITWLHINSVSNISLDIDFASSHHVNNNFETNKTFLVIITGNRVSHSLIKLISLNPRKIQVLTNISLDQFDQFEWSNSFLSLQLISDLHKGSFQDQTITTYISAGSPAAMQTTIYQFKSNYKFIYRIRINIDGSNAIPYKNMFDKTCHTYSQNNISVSLSINLKNWKKFHKWTPWEFQLGNNSCIFQKKRNGMYEITRQAKQCSAIYKKRRYINQIYGVWNKKYILIEEINFSCRKQKTKITPVTTTTRLSSEHFIPKAKEGFLISNKSDYKFSLVTPLYDKMEMYFQLTIDINGGIVLANTFQLRDCYISNRRAAITDFKSSIGRNGGTFRKMILVHEGCLDNSSHWYSNIPGSLRPNRVMAKELFGDYGVYRFSVVVDADNWAKTLTLEQQWLYEGQFEVHLYCGINKCLLNQMSGSPIPLCRSQAKQCSRDVLAIDPLMKYYGVLLIAKKYEYVTFKISVLIILSVMIPLLICIVIFFWRFHSFRPHRSHSELRDLDKFSIHEKTIDPDVSFSNPCKRSSNPDYHSLTLLECHDKKSAAKIYSEPKIIISLKRLVENCDKSIFLHAGYLNSAITDPQSQSLTTTTQPTCVSKKLRIHSHSAAEVSFTEPPTLTNWVLNSWPLSSTDCKTKRPGRNITSSKPKTNANKVTSRPPFSCNWRSANVKQCKSPDPNNSWQQNTNSSGSSSKQKISYTFNSEPKSVSNPKVSSNRTTVSESISANDVTTNKSTGSKWWSLLTNYWMNQSFVMSRN